MLLGLFLNEIQHKLLPSATCCCRGNKGLRLWHSLVSRLVLNFKLQASVRVNFSGFAANAAVLLCSYSFSSVFSWASMLPFSPQGQCPHLSQCVAQTVGATSPGFMESLVGLMEHRKEYQLKGHKYLRAEIFDNVMVGG